LSGVNCRIDNRQNHDIIQPMDIRKAREAQGITQEQLAAKLGLSSRTVMRREKVNKLPGNKLIARAWRRLIGMQ
jgi:DNA-binding transcriptional regulator YiaG